MNTTTLDMTTLDGGVIIKKGGGGTSPTPTPPSGGSADLEGEYFLAKPNGRYWKSKFAKMLRGKYPVIDGSVFTDEQLEIISSYCVLFAIFGYTATYDYGGVPSSGSEVILSSPIEVSNHAGIDKCSIFRYRKGEASWISLMGAWQECNIHGTIMGVTFEGGLIDFMRLSFEGDLDAMTDDEVLAFISEGLMLEQVTKEEYESYYNW